MRVSEHCCLSKKSHHAIQPLEWSCTQLSRRLCICPSSRPDKTCTRIQLNCTRFNPMARAIGRRMAGSSYSIGVQPYEIEPITLQRSRADIWFQRKEVKASPREPTRRERTLVRCVEIGWVGVNANLIKSTPTAAASAAAISIHGHVLINVSWHNQVHVRGRNGLRSSVKDDWVSAACQRRPICRSGYQHMHPLSPHIAYSSIVSCPLAQC